MKKVIFIVMIAMANNSNVFAQNNNSDHIHHDDDHIAPRDAMDKKGDYLIGLKAGVNFSNVYSEDGNGFKADTKVGFAGGGYISLPIMKYIGLQAEILVSQKGFSATGQILGSSYSFTRTTTYLDIPVFFAFTPIKSVTLLAGPQYSYLMKKTDIFTNGTTSILQEKEFDNDNVRRNTLCLVIGADLNLKHIVLSARGGWDVRENNGDGSSTTPRYKNMWLQTTIGYRF